MTIKEIADELKVKVTAVKQLLRIAFPEEDFSSPDCPLTSSQVQRIREGIREHLVDRRRGATSGSADDIGSQATLVSPAVILPFVANRRSVAAPLSRSSHTLWVHQDVFDFLHDPRAERRIKAATLRLMREMLVEGRAQRRVKGTRGINNGWLRAPLGDNGGFHFYLWHALHGNPPVKELELPRGDVLLREVRHHDETKKKLLAGALTSCIPLRAVDYVRDLEAAADVLSPEQREACEKAVPLSIIKGHPGAGKTTLHLERARRYPGRLMFLTFGAAQCEQARRWLETYADAEQEITAWTHEQFFQALIPSWRPAPSIAEAVEALRGVAEISKAAGPWAGKWETLYFELRAHFWGRAAPIGMPGQEIADCLDEDRKAYQTKRASLLGDAAVRAVGEVVRVLPAELRERLFGDLHGVRRCAGDLLRGVAIPSALQGLAAILVDEVQDLTAIEQHVIVLVARSSGASMGHRTALHTAGDEGQTVRATDFEWGALKKLINDCLGAPVEFDLPGNLRSPRTITKVINNSWALYKSMSKSRRPKGYAAADVDETSIGSVLWVEVGKDLERLCQIVATTPGAALIYPGSTVPAEVRDAARRASVVHVGSAAELKGLDFRVAVVLDVGRRADELYREVPKNGQDAILELENRSAVDTIRVAISRGTEVLVFAERQLGFKERARLSVLCMEGDGLIDGVVTDIALGELEARLDLDGDDHAELVSEALSNFELTFADDALAGLRIMERARGWLGESNRASSVKGELRRLVHEKLGLALLRCAIENEEYDEGSFRSANAALNNAKDTELARLALEVRDLLGLHPSGAKAAAVVAVAAGGGREGAPTSDARFYASLALEKLLSRSSGWIAKGDRRNWERSLGVLESIADFASGQQELSRLHAQALESVAQAVVARPMSENNTQSAERLLALMRDPPAELAAHLAERAKRWTDAVRWYCEAGKPDQALRVSREHGADDALSLSLARQVESPEALMLERLVRLRQDLAALVGAVLTENEARRLDEEMRRVRPARRSNAR